MESIGVFEEEEVFTVGEVVVTQVCNENFKIKERGKNFLIVRRIDDTDNEDEVYEEIINGLKESGIITHFDMWETNTFYGVRIELDMRYLNNGREMTYSNNWVSGKGAPDIMPYVYKKIFDYLVSLGIYNINFSGYGGLNHYIEFVDGERVVLLVKDYLFRENKDNVLRRVCRAKYELIKYLAYSNIEDCITSCDLKRFNDIYGDRFFL